MHTYIHIQVRTEMKQIPSQFLEDSEHEKLVEIKTEKGWNWKQLILSVLDNNKNTKGENNVR